MNTLTLRISLLSSLLLTNFLAAGESTTPMTAKSAQEIHAIAVAPTLMWGKQLGTAAEDFGKTITVDREGRCTIAGHTEGDMGAKSSGKKDVFVAAFDTNGQQRWIAQFGTTEDDAAMSIALAPDGSFYVGGVTRGKLGDSQSGGSDVFLAKLDNSGQVLWKKQFGTAADDMAEAIAIDSQGNVLITGGTAGKMGEKQMGTVDALVIKVSPDGTLLWTCQWGSKGNDMCKGISVDHDGNSFVTGSTDGSMEGCTNAGSQDIFVSKISPAGAPVWSRQFGTPAPEMGLNLRVDSKGSIYVTGSSAGDLAGVQVGQGDSVLLKLSDAGTLEWKKQFGTQGWDGIHGIAFSTEGADSVIVGGCQAWDKCEGFQRCFASDGKELWSTKLPASQAICGTQVAIDAEGNIYQTGGTHGPAFGPYAGKGNDIIVAKLSFKKR